jgi:DNA gyrase subunit A
MEMLTDIEKETVDFAPNYDGEFSEPTVLPARFPNLLVNGSSGIAVGMSTNMPPHNLTDVCNAVLLRMENKREGRETPIKELISIVRAPDYPTGGAILGVAGIHEAYLTGRGRVVLRADALIEPLPGQANREQIRVTAIPYQVNKANLVKHMADLVKDKKIDGITDIRDESNRNGVRIVVELRRDANANVILNQLYKLSPLQTSYGIINLALVNGEPKTLNLAEMIEHYITHQQEVVTRRSQFELAKAEKRAHILEGLLKALDHIDEIIRLIRASMDGNEARERLIAAFDFTKEQAQAIVDMRLRALTGLEKERLQREYDELMALIAELKKILGDGNYLLEIIAKELTAIRDKFGDVRKTDILHDPGEINYEDLIDDTQAAFTLSHLGYIKRIGLDAYRSQARGGKGVMGMQTREEDWVTDLFVANTHDHILFFTTRGRAFSLRGYEIPEAGRTAKGMPLVNLLNLSGEEKVAAMIPVQKDDWGGYLLMVTKQGLVKRTELVQFRKINKAGLIAINFREDDMLIEVLHTDGLRELFLAAASGRGIRFPEHQIRPSGRTAMGVRGMKLRDDDRIIGATAADGQVLLAGERGYGKVLPVDTCRGQNRAGMGIIMYKTSEKTGDLVGIKTVTESDDLMIITSEGVIIRLRVADISVQGRYASGVKLINIPDGVTIMSIAKVAEEESGDTDGDE